MVTSHYGMGGYLNRSAWCSGSTSQCPRRFAVHAHTGAIAMIDTQSAACADMASHGLLSGPDILGKREGPCHPGWPARWWLSYSPIA